VRISGWRCDNCGLVDTEHGDYMSHKWLHIELGGMHERQVHLCDTCGEVALAALEPLLGRRKGHA
jgi:hypothetical protein